MALRVADYIAQRLVEHEIDAAFFLSGGGMMHLIDAVGRQPGLRYYCHHHEQAAAMAADAYARASGKVGVCYLTSGPGGVNALTGVVEAWLDSSPILCISGQSKRSQTIRGRKLWGLRQYGTFEVDVIPIAGAVCKYTCFLDDPKMIQYELEKCLYMAQEGRPGPVWMDIPIDVQGALVERDQMPFFVPPVVPKRESLKAAVATLASHLKKARRPLILAGHGVKAARAVGDFRLWVERLGIPVATTPFAVDLIPYDHPLFVGHPSIKGDRAGNFAVQNTDLMISLGQSFHVMTTGYQIADFAPNAKKIMVEIDPCVIQRQEISLDLVIETSVQDFLAEWRELEHETPSIFKPTLDPRWIEYCQRLKRELKVTKEPHPRVVGSEGTSLTYYDLVDLLSDLSHDEAQIVTDAGFGFYIVGQAFRARARQHVINSGGLGTMGFALPAAMGAAAARPEAPVICITGDGSLQTNIQELASIRHYGFDLKIFVVNNGGYVSIRNTQSNYFEGHLVGSSPATGVWLPSLEKIAAAYEIPYTAVRTLEELAATLNRTLAHQGPIICEVFTPHEAEVIPTVSSQRNPDGTMTSKPLHDMYPFWTPENLARWQFPQP